MPTSHLLQPRPLFEPLMSACAFRSPAVCCVCLRPVHEEGSPAAGFSLILSGALSEYQRQYSGQTGAGRYLRKLGPGKGFGEEALTQPTTR